MQEARIDGRDLVVLDLPVQQVKSARLDVYSVAVLG